MKCIAIIPARGGSKRLPKKNILPFLGRPIISYSIQAALDAGIFYRVVVSTESEEIEEVALKSGAEVDRRRPDLATDNATVVEVCLDFLEREQSVGREYDVLCCCYATAPLRTAKDIISVVSLLEPGVCDYSMAVTDYVHYAHQALRQEPNGFLVPMWPELTGLRADAVGKLVGGNGSTYAVNVPSFLVNKRFYGSKMRGHHMPFYRSIDIDTQDDFELALAVTKHFDLIVD
jgi:pseudaminic acid cytidylyltransferase